MRTARTALTALVLAGALSAAAAALPSAPALTQPALNAAVGVAVGVHGAVGVDFFYSNLAPYGYWVNRPSVGWVWLPRHIRHGWRPYSYGRWAYTDYGWTWVSSEPFGWATYHYGRWNLDPDYGWEWQPGTDWGPAWVSWQEGDGYLGWAPLPPQVGWSAGVGLDLGGFNLGVGIDPGWYCFVPERSFLAVNVATFAVPPSRNFAFFRNTTNITNIRFAGGRPFNGSVPVNRIQQVTGQPVRQFRLANAADPRVARISGNSVAMFRPAAVVRRANAPDPTRVAPRAVATGRVAQQLAQQRRGEAAQFRQGGQRPGEARTAQATAGRNAGPGAATRGQNLARRQAAPNNRQPQALGRRQVTPPPQRTRGGVPPTRGARAQQVHQYVPPSQRTAAQRRQQGQVHRQSAPPPRQQAVSRRQPSPQRQRQMQTPGRRQQVPPPQRQPQAQARRQSPPSQVQRQQAPAPRREPQVQRQAPPPQRQAQAMRQPAPQRPQRQASPPPQRPARGQQQPQREPPPPGGGAGANR